MEQSRHEQSRSNLLKFNNKVKEAPNWSHYDVFAILLKIREHINLPSSIYLFKFNIWNIGKRYEMCSKLFEQGNVSWVFSSITLERYLHVRLTLATKKSYILTQNCCFQLQVCLSMCELLWTPGVREFYLLKYWCYLKNLEKIVCISGTGNVSFSKKFAYVLNRSSLASTNDILI